MINRNGIKKILKAGIISIIILIVLGYAYFAFHNFVNGPEIIVIEPKSGISTTTSSIKIIGKALRVQNITLNGRPIIIDDKGNFDENIILAPGYNVSLLSAHDKFGRTTEYKIDLVYKKE